MEQSRCNPQSSRCFEKTEPNVAKFNHSIPEQFLPDSTKKGNEIIVHVGAVRNPTQFWVILKEGLLDVADLMYYIQEVYFDKTQSQELKISQEDVRLNMFCVTLHEGEFNPAIVRKIYKERNQVEILFVDYGTVSLIDSRELYYLLEQFSYLPQQAIKTKLAGIRSTETKWSAEAIQEFSGMVGDFRELTATILKIDRKNKILKVKLMNDQNGESVGDVLISKNLALEENPVEKLSNLKDPISLMENSETDDLPNIVKMVMDIPTQFSLSNFKKNDEVSLRVSDLLNPSKFWATLSDSYDDLQKLTEELRKTFGGRIPKKRIPFDEITEGLPCVALIGLKYCRAVITRIKMEGEVNIFCFDYGNFCSIDQTQLYHMYERFVDLPQQAIRTTLVRIVPREPSTRWSSAAIDKFAEMVHQRTFRAKISSLDHERQVLQVSLTDCSTANRICINTALVEQQLASVSL